MPTPTIRISITSASLLYPAASSLPPYPFAHPNKHFRMIHNPKSQHFISWMELGASFVVSNVSELSRKVEAITKLMMTNTMTKLSMTLSKR